MADELTTMIILTVSAFAPPLLFLAWVRRTERFGREPWRGVLRTFAWGAVFAVIIAVILSLLLFFLFNTVDRVYVFSGRFPNLQTIVLAIVIAPFAEELAKGLGVYAAHPRIREAEDGLVYGAASGFGFAASENLLYGFAALVATGELTTSLIVIGVRSVSSALLHASATAAYGYGIALRQIWAGRRSAAGYYLLAVLMHASFNFLASVGELYRDAGEIVLIGALFAATLFALAAFSIMRAKIAHVDVHGPA